MLAQHDLYHNSTFLHQSNSFTYNRPMALFKIKTRSISRNFIFRLSVKLCYIPGTSIFLFALIEHAHILLLIVKNVHFCTNNFEYDQTMFDNIIDNRLYWQLL